MLDANVWVSALHFGGPPRAALVKAWVDDHLATCAPIRAEVQRTLLNKLGWSAAQVMSAMDAYAGMADVEIKGEIARVCRDPKDDMVFACAVQADARAIVTGDRDLLVVGTYRHIRVLTVREYLQLP